ncbi:MAG: adhesion lipoprotein [Chloroflexi bacterium HGW-Chloroflexi-10]|nr:MAG: adhesion lipoprotein [Chloroflexi bacterium HGW-Chloroflexi-10]
MPVTGNETPTPKPESTAVPTEAPQTIVDIAAADGRFTTLVAAVQAADLATTLSGEGPFTVFAPTDDAFAKLPAGTVEALLADVDTLTSILLYHVVSGTVMAADVVELTSADTVNGLPVDIKVMDGKVFINEAEVIITDIEASNGVIHVIDTVILPPADIVDTAIADGRFTTLVTAVQAAGLVETLKGEGPFTVFAPTDEAFAKLPAGTIDALLADPEALANVLLYHVVAGKVMAADVAEVEYALSAQGAPIDVLVKDGKVFVNNAEVILTDIKTANGVIHVIDTVILPPADIVDTAIADGRFTTLVAAVQAAGLADALKGEGPLTVFAPTDEAFAKLPAGTVDALLADPEALANILLYHVADGRLMAADVVASEKIETLQGKSASVTVDMGKAMLDNAEIVITDILTSNGVIHVIDSVILPQNDIVETAVADGRFTTLVAALQAADLVETLQGEGPFTVFAPTDDAFKKLPAGTVETLLQPENLEQLTNILLYHVVSGKVMAADVVTLTSAGTVFGQDVTIKVMDGKVYINEAQVIITDIETYNGVIHVIDSVLLPLE